MMQWTREDAGSYRSGNHFGLMHKDGNVGTRSWSFLIEKRGPLWYIVAKNSALKSRNGFVCKSRGYHTLKDAKAQAETFRLRAYVQLIWEKVGEYEWEAEGLSGLIYTIAQVEGGWGVWVDDSPNPYYFHQGLRDDGENDNFKDAQYSAQGHEAVAYNA
jgi:hypothetical protein